MNRRDLSLDLIAFAGTVLSVWAFKWDAGDVIWGLWICSLSVGYTYIITSILAPIIHLKGKVRWIAIGGGLFLIGFFTVHFGMFHYVHAAFLDDFFPLDGKSSDKSIIDLLRLTVPAYWPLILTTFISRWSDFPIANTFSADTSGRDIGKVMTKPYANVVRMHLLIFVFAGLHAAKLTHLAIYPVLAAYFFPWGELFGTLKRKRSTSAASEDGESG